ncbi:MAG: hypothetical protein ACYS0E_14325 [Planctomycetota bacterium]|jgi:hypothetical protein
MRCLALLLALATTALADGEKDPRVMGEGKAPTPFTAEQIRWASPEGRVTVLRVKSPRGPVLVQFSFGKSDAETTTFETAAMSLKKDAIGPPTSRTVKWTELQGHASYDKDATTITEESVTVPLGKYDCYVYTVKRGEELHRYAFAKILPGPPVYVSIKKGEEVVQTMEMVEHRCFDYEKVLGPQAVGKEPFDATGWSASAQLEAAGETGQVKIVASLTGAKPPLACKLRVTKGPLKGAVLNLGRDKESQRMVCDKILPAGFRTGTGRLEVEVVEAASSK